MARWRRFCLRLFNVLRPWRAESDLDRELASHLGLLEQEYRRRGLSVEEATLAAKRAFGSVARAKDLHRDTRSFVWLDDARRNLRYAVRTLGRTPGFTAVAVLTLAVGIFAGVAVLLAVIGLYGVIAYCVMQRTREIGIRMALGATRSDILATVLGQSAILTIADVGFGLLGAIAVTRYLRGMLFGIRPLDPLTFVAVSLLFAVAAVLASYLPARRAARVDPLVALRCE